MATEPEAINMDITADKSSDMYVGGLAPPYLINLEAVKKAMEAEEKPQDKNKRPPKPPSRPNIPIGRVAIENGF